MCISAGLSGTDNNFFCFSEILRGYVELSQPAATHDLRTLIEVTTSDAIRAELFELRRFLSRYCLIAPTKRPGPPEECDVPPHASSHTNSTILDLFSIMEHSECHSYCERTRSRSLLRARETFSRCCDQLFEVVPGDRVHMSVHASAVAFHPPEDPTIPFVEYCAGSGLALIRGFIQVSSKISFIKWLLIGSDI